MSLESFIPSVWAGELLMNLEKSLVFGNVANRDYEGEITSYGDEVIINEIGDITVSDYTESTTITPQNLDDAAKKLKIDQQKYFAFKVNDVAKAQSKPQVMVKAMQKASYNLRDKADVHIAGFYTDAGIEFGSDGAPKSVNSANAVEMFAEVGRLLTQNNVPLEGRWIVIPPWLHTKLVLAKLDLTLSGNDGTFGTGYVGTALGFNIFISNNVQYGSSGSATVKSKVMAGFRESISFASQVLDLEAYRPESSFADAIKGLYVFGGKVVRPDALAVMTASFASE